MENEWLACLITVCIFIVMIALTYVTKKQRERIRQIEGEREEFKGLIVVLKNLIKWK
jgi:predicted peroxiredoxin